MGKKASSQFVCTTCGYISSKWFGRCPDCSSWSTFEEQKISAARSGKKNKSVFRGSTSSTAPIPIDEVTRDPASRWQIGFSELDTVLGDGVADGAFILLGGEPGIGKSTLLLQVAFLSANQGKKVLYITGEESASQIKLRAERLDCLSSNILLFPENDLDVIFEQLEGIAPEIEIPLKRSS